MIVEEAVEPARDESSPPRSDRVTFFLHVFLLLAGLLISSPIWIALFASFKLPADITNYPPTLLPEVWTLENYVTAWSSQPLLRYFMNSVIQTGIIVLFQVVFSILASVSWRLMPLQCWIFRGAI
jgi:ABC-type glycerol-3-phosphate transport system permease component